MLNGVVVFDTDINGFLEKDYYWIVKAYILSAFINDCDLLNDMKILSIAYLPIITDPNNALIFVGWSINKFCSLYEPAIMFKILSV